MYKTIDSISSQLAILHMSGVINMPSRNGPAIPQLLRPYRYGLNPGTALNIYTYISPVILLYIYDVRHLTSIWNYINQVGRNSFDLSCHLTYQGLNYTPYRCRLHTWGESFKTRFQQYWDGKACPLASAESYSPRFLCPSHRREYPREIPFFRGIPSLVRYSSICIFCNSELIFQLPSLWRDYPTGLFNHWAVPCRDVIADCCHRCWGWCSEGSLAVSEGVRIELARE